MKRQASVTIMSSDNVTIGVVKRKRWNCYDTVKRWIRVKYEMMYLLGAIYLIHASTTKDTMLWAYSRDWSLLFVLMNRVPMFNGLEFTTRKAMVSLVCSPWSSPVHSLFPCSPKQIVMFFNDWSCEAISWSDGDRMVHKYFVLDSIGSPCIFVTRFLHYCLVSACLRSTVRTIVHLINEWFREYLDNKAIFRSIGCILLNFRAYSDHRDLSVDTRSIHSHCILIFRKSSFPLFWHNKVSKLVFDFDVKFFLFFSRKTGKNNHKWTLVFQSKSDDSRQTHLMVGVAPSGRAASQHAPPRLHPDGKRVPDNWTTRTEFWPLVHSATSFPTKTACLGTVDWN